MALTTKRLNWLKWLYPGEGGLQSEQQWLIDKRRNHMKGEHSFGIVEGLAVLATGTPDLDVHVQPGRAIGVEGEEIVIDSIVDLDLSSYAAGGGTAYIVAEYATQGTDPYIVPETATSQDKFTQDNPTVSHQGTAPTGNQIELGRVQVTNGATQIFDAIYPLAINNNRINHMNRVVALAKSNGEEVSYKIIKPGAGTILEQLALLGVSDGDRFWIEPGTYDLHDVGTNHIFTWSNVTIEGPKAAIVTKKGPGMFFTGGKNMLRGFTVDVDSTAGDSTIFSVTATDGGCVFDDLEVTLSSSYGAYPIALTNSPRNRVTRCVFAGTGLGTILISGSTAHDNVIEQCEFSQLGTGYNLAAVKSIWGNASDAGPGTKIRDCTFNLGEPPASGSQERIGVGIGSSWVVENCNFVTTSTDTTYTFGVWVDPGDGNTDDWRVARCRFNGIAYGVYGNMNTNLKCSGWVVETSLFETRSASVYFRNDGIGRGLHSKIVNNTFSEYSSSANGYLCFLELCDHVVVEGNTWTGSGVVSGMSFNSCEFFKFVGNSMKFTVDGDIRGVNVQVFSVNGLICDNAIEVNNTDTVNKPESTGIYCGASYTVIKGNNIRVTSSTAQFAGRDIVGIELLGAEHCVVSQNYIFVESDNDLQSPACIGILLDANCDWTIIEGNNMQGGGTGNVRRAIELGGSPRCTVNDNNAFDGFTNPSFNGSSPASGILDGNTFNGAGTVGSMTPGTNVFA